MLWFKSDGSLLAETLLPWGNTSLHPIKVFNRLGEVPSHYGEQSALLKDLILN